MRAYMLVAVALIGCRDKGDTDGLPADSGDGAATDCGQTPPTIDTLTVTDEGMSDPAVDDVCGPDPVPRIRITAAAADEDGDLHYYSMRLFWDDDIDGLVAAEGDYSEITGTIGQECRVFTASIATILCVTGDPPFSRDLEFGAILYDDRDNASNGGVPDVTEFTTPDAEGNY